MKRIALCAVLVACSGKSSSSGTTTPVLPDVAFESLDHDQRIQFMKEQVVPAMTPLFQKHDAIKYKDFGCKTCHGEGAAKGEFHMPNDKLPKLDFADPTKHKQADLDWMKNEVKPAMARLLREAEYSAENPQGFGCLHCHTPEPK